MKRFYKTTRLPCSITIPRIEESAKKHGCVLLACNNVHLDDLAPEESAYTGPDMQELLFILPALSEDLAEQTLAHIATDLVGLYQPALVNERAFALVNAPTSTTPQRNLITAREIKHAIDRNVQGGNYGVYAIVDSNGRGKSCEVSGTAYRVYDARTDKGVLKVKVNHGWIKADRIYSEG